MPRIHPERTDRKLAWQVNAFCEAIGISRTTFYELVKKQQIRTIAIGGRVLVPDSEVQRLLSQSSSGGVTRGTARNRKGGR